MSKETARAGMHYILTFYNDIVALTTLYSQYVNLLKELEFKHGKTPVDTMQDSEKEALTQTVKAVRQTCTVLHNQNESIKHMIKLDDGGIIWYLAEKIEGKRILKKIEEKK